MKRGAQQANPALGGRTYPQQQEFSTSEEYLASVRAGCDTRSPRKDLICVTLAAEPLPFEENDYERTYRLACDHEGRIEACEGYATMMERRGDASRARVISRSSARVHRAEVKQIFDQHLKDVASNLTLAACGPTT